MTVELRPPRTPSTGPEIESGISSLPGLIGGSLAGGMIAFYIATHYFGQQPISDSLTTLLWYAVRGAGISAYLALWLTTVAGLCISGRIGGRVIPGGIWFPIHQLGDLALSLAVLHASLLLGDRFAGFTPDTLVIPFVATYRPLWTGLGIVALYLMAVVYWSAALRPRLGYRMWRLIHYASFLIFGLALVHGLASGTDSPVAPMRFMYLLTGATIVALTVWRWQRSRSGKRPVGTARPT